MTPSILLSSSPTLWASSASVPSGIKPTVGLKAFAKVWPDLTAISYAALLFASCAPSTAP